MKLNKKIITLNLILLLAFSIPITFSSAETSTTKCENKSKSYNIFASEFVNWILTKNTWNPQEWNLKKKETENKCKGKLKLESTKKMLDCTSFCNQWECKSDYSHPPLKCDEATAKITKDLISGNVTSVLFNSKGSVKTKCNCKEKKKIIT